MICPSYVAKELSAGTKCRIFKPGKREKWLCVGYKQLRIWIMIQEGHSRWNWAAWGATWPQVGHQLLLFCILLLAATWSRDGFPGGSRVKSLPAMRETWAGEGNGTPRQYSCLINPMDGGAWPTAAHRVRHDGATEHKDRYKDISSHLDQESSLKSGHSGKRHLVVKVWKMQ